MFTEASSVTLRNHESRIITIPNIIIGSMKPWATAALDGMMINHSTLNCYVTFSTRSLAGPKRLIETLTL